MSSVVFICNLGLTNIGKPAISSLTEASAEAAACSRYYEHVRDLALQSYPWRFAGKTAALAEITNDRAGQWDYAYQRPTDCLKIRALLADPTVDPETLTDLPVTTPQGFPYWIEGSTLYTDLSPAFLDYTRRLTDPTKFSPLFVEYLGWEMAVRLAMPLTKDQNVRKEARAAAIVARGEAEVADANEVRETSDHQTEFVTGR